MVSLRSFVDKVQGEMKVRGKIPADIARTGIVTDAAVSKLFSLQQKSVGYKMVLAIATALDVPEAIVRQWAGITSDQRESVMSDDIQEIVHVLEGMTKEEQQEYLSYLRYMQNRKKK